MKSRSALVAMLFSCLLTLMPEAGAALEIEPKHADFGSHPLFGTIEQSYRVRNPGERAVKITRWFAASGVGTVEGLPESLQPGEEAQFRVRLPLAGDQGQLSRRFALFTDEPGVDRYRFSLSGFAYSLVEPEQAVLDFRDVLRGREESLSIQLSARESQPLRLERVVEQPAWARTRIDGSLVHVTVGPDVPSGLQGAQVRIATNLPQQPFVEIGLVAVGRGGLEASENFVVFTPGAVGETVEKTIEVTHPSADLARQLRVEPNTPWRFTRKPCEPARAGCLRLGMTRKLDTVGRELGEFVLGLGQEDSLRLKYGVITMAEGQRMREINLDTAPVDTPEPSAAASPAPTQAPARIAPGQGPAPVRLKWRARNTLEIFGFLVYRASSRAGPFTRVSSPVLAGPEGDFEFVDEAVQIGSTYYYYVDSISRKGRKERFSPVVSKTITAD